MRSGGSAASAWDAARRADVVILTAIRQEFEAVLDVDAGAVPSSAWERGSEDGLYFEAEGGGAQLVSGAALAEAFGAAGESVQLVVLSACYSEPQAEAILAHVGCVVGVSGKIGEASARNFAIGFYGGLGERASIADAYKHGRAAIGLGGLTGGDRLQLKVRPGIDASRVVLADPR